MISSRWPRPLVHRLTRDDARGLHVGHGTLFRFDRAFAVDRVAETVDHAAEQRVTDRHVHDRVRALDGVAFFNVTVRTEDNDTDVVGFEVQRHAPDATGEFDHFTGLHVVEAIDTGDTVTDGEHVTDFGHLGLLAKVLDLVLEDRRNLGSLDTHSLIRPLSWNSGVRSGAKRSSYRSSWTRLSR